MASALKEAKWSEIFFGKNFDYGYLCTPVFPYFRNEPRKPPLFYGADSKLGVVVAAAMGLQHALAMVIGLSTPALLIGLMANNFDTQRKLIMYSLIVCGISTILHVLGLRIPGTRVQFGTGCLSVMGVSFSTVPVAQSVIKKLMADGNTFDDAFGKLVGTIVVAAITPIIVSFFPPKALRKLFPPIVSGVAIMLIGFHLTGAGIKYWGGGNFCYDHYHDPLSKPIANCFSFNATTAQYTPIKGSSCYTILPRFTCGDNGEVKEPFGSPVYVGMGFLVFGTIVLVEIFGSPFMRNVSVFIGLLLGYFIAAVAKFDGRSMVTTTKMDSAPGIDFLWTKTFPIGFYPPALLPLIFVFIITSIESVADVTATEEASRLPTEGESHDMRMRGALLNDGVTSMFSSLSFSLPLTTFAQNNGVIALTNVASQEAGIACGIWLFFMGVISKVSAFILSTPHCVLGGMTTFLFANVVSSGLKIIVSDKFSRRNRFILGCALALGVGVTLVPEWADLEATSALWPSVKLSDGAASIRDAIMLILNTGFVLGTVTAFVLNLVLPEEQVDSHEELVLAHHADEKSALPTNDDPSFIPTEQKMAV